VEALNLLGEVSRKQGKLDEAAGYYQRCVTIGEASGVNHTYPRLNLAIVEMDRGNWEAARRATEATLAVVEGQGHGRLTTCCYAMLTRVASAQGQWAVFDAHLDAFERIYWELNFFEADLMKELQGAAAFAEAAGETARAERATALGRVVGAPAR